MRKFAAIFAAVLLSSSGAGAQEAPGVLVHAGALNCLASRAEDVSPPETTNLECQLRLAGTEMKSRRYDGRMVGSGLWLVDPGPVRLVWQVLVPSEELSFDTIEGDYDVVTSHDYEIAEAEGKVLFGGAGDTVALRLLAPAVDGISPSTRLTLEDAGSG